MNIINLEERRRRLRTEHPGAAIATPAPNLGQLMARLALMAAREALEAHERQHHPARPVARRTRRVGR